MAQDPYKYFRVEARELTDQLGKGLLDLERTGDGSAVVPRLLRLAHTLKGAARVVRQPEIADHAHAIEDALSPLREIAGRAPRDNVEAALKLVDAVSARLAGLQAAPEQPGAPPSAAVAGTTALPAVAEDSWRSVHTDVGEIDALLDGIGETYAQVTALRDAGSRLEDAGRMAELLADQIGLAAGSGTRGGSAGRFDRAHTTAEDLRDLIHRLERTVASVGERLDRELRDVRDGAEQLRLVTAGTLFGTLARVVRDAAQALGKDVAFEGKGGDVRLDAHVVRTVQEALLQLVRNAVAHGIESRRDRAATGKPGRGQVSMEFSRRGRHVVIHCRDDGRGIDLDALRRAAAAKGAIPADLARLDANGIIGVMLKGGISTSPTVTEVSGRGIGMDIVREAIEKLGGDVHVTTGAGTGTTFELVVPLSISSVDVLLVETAGMTAAIPIEAVRHTLRLTARDIYRTSLGDAIVYEGSATPFVTLRQLLAGGTGPHGRDVHSAIVVAGEGGHAAIGVDRLLGIANVVIRALPDLMPPSPIVAGASLDADGSPQLMLDPDGLVALAMSDAAAPMAEAAAALPVLVIDDSLTTRMLEQSILESAGYEVDVATSAEDGLVAVRRRAYSLILVDVEMPGMDGFTFVETIRADPVLADIPAILVTSRAAPEDLKRGTDVGAQGYVIKSEFNQAELLASIERLAIRR